MPTSYEQLVAGASPGVAAELGAMGDAAARFDDLVRRGREGLPEVPVAPSAWVAFLGRHLEAGEVATQMQELRAEDVHLVLGCLAGEAAAHRRLDEQLRRVGGQALVGIRIGTLAVDEVIQTARVKLLTGDAPKLASYAGRGPLEGWLRVLVARTGLSMLRARAPAEKTPRDDDALSELADGDDPRLAAIRARCAPVLRSAVEQAARELPAADRMLLRMHVVDGLTIDDLAQVYGTHRATAARRLARARNALVEGARRLAVASLGLEDEEELASLSGLLLSRIDVTMRRVLGAGDDEGTPG